MRERVLWPAGLLLLGVLVGIQVATFLLAPVVFSFVAAGTIDSTTAGHIAGGMFSRVGGLTIVALPLLMGAGMATLTSLRARRAFAILMITTMVLQLVESGVVTPGIAALREAMTAEFGSVSATPADDARRAQFGMLHGVSVVRGLVQAATGAGAFLVMLLGRQTG
jgi:hypothetical protein